MSFVKREIPTLKSVTKRTILKYSSQIYDPLGLLSPVTVPELQAAEHNLLRDCQASAFHEEILQLQSGSIRATLVKQLRLFLDASNLLRCSGKIHNAPLEDSAKFPILLPQKDPLTRFIIQDAHERHLHSGVNATVTYLRQKYWVPAIRQIVKSIIRKCVTCRNVIGQPYSAPDPPPLPKIRVEEAPPFTVTGVDFAGPLYVKEKTGSESKAYVCLFTCAVTRAVHLEVLSRLSEDCFLQVFRRFISRRSLPKLMISDNATTFQAASSQIKRLFQSSTVKDTLSDRGTEWKFIPQRAPWYGGFWERLIGLTKSTLKKVLGRTYLNMESLQTVVTEIEAVMNDRPLTYTSSNSEDPDALTPSHLLQGRRMSSLPFTDVFIDSEINPASSHSNLTRRTKVQTQIMGQFWARWRREYLTALREYHRKSGSRVQTISDLS